ncbi:MAG: hypothetical protein IT385_20015 [Deltaproteobacteria bacterium]|nr:hypothetical protein [Deltaproteobacteria bacterium]
MTTTVSRQLAFDYDRTVVAFHGTRRQAAESLVSGEPFGPSQNDDDWLGHGIYFWEYAPQQAWWWAERRYGPEDAAVVGALVRLGSCFDLLDPANIEVLQGAHDELSSEIARIGGSLRANANNHKYLDCRVFNWLFAVVAQGGWNIESTRAVFVPMIGGRQPRLWPRSGVFSGAHIQLSIREPRNILAVWPVRRDGRYGRDP